MTREFRVIVVGAGPAGAATTLALQRKGIATTLVDRSLISKWRIGETLAPEARHLLDAFGLMEAFLDGHHLACHGISSAWGEEALATTDFIFNPNGCGWQLDRAEFDTAFVHAAQRSGANVLRGQSILAIRRQGDIWEVETNAEKLRACYLVDATGHASVIAKRMGASRTTLDRLVSVYLRADATILSDRDTRTLIEAVPDGWWYTALTPGGKRTVSFQTDIDLLKRANWRSSSWFQTRIRETRHLYELLKVSEYSFATFPSIISARSSRLDKFFGDAWVAVGDAAVSFDPLSGQGMLRAIEAGVMAADALAAGSGGLESYAVWVASVWKSYVKSWNRYYRVESRWPDQPFWARRHGAID
ncbi:FAD-dependent oxidoreductase [Paraburkholderia sp. RL17-347-BIC-D]|uniref:FAD-dependent oxidoreductase n=1 Tax=Paraburkholderia sp. RL17-347-BIC-D TaxID=3031632 RepID=UPI0038BBAC53